MYVTQAMESSPFRLILIFFAAVPDLPANTHLWRTGLEFAVRPPRPPSIHESTIARDVFHPAVISQEPIPLPLATTQAFAQAKDAANALIDTPSPGDEVLILPLGTSSAVPTKYRNGESDGLDICVRRLKWIGTSVVYVPTDPSRRRHTSGLWRGYMGTACSFLWGRSLSFFWCLGMPSKYQVYLPQSPAC